MAINFDLSPEQAGLQKAARSFAEDRLSLVEGVIAPLPTPEARFAAIKPFYQDMVDAGFMKALVPVEYGGTAMPSLDFALAAEELTRVDINVPTALLGTGLGLQPIIHFGTAEQKAQFLPPSPGANHSSRRGPSPRRPAARTSTPATPPPVYRPSPDWTETNGSSTVTSTSPPTDADSMETAPR